MPKTTFALLIAITSLLISSTTFAASFQSLEQSAARLGAADAGTATNSNDAAIEYYNPAGMPLIGHKALSVSGIGVFAHLHMYDAKAWDYSGNPVTGSSKSPKSEAIIPGIHYVQPINHDFAIGGGLTVPYGLETIYPESSIARYLATKSVIETINLALSGGYRLTNRILVGAGFDAEYFDATLNQTFDSQFLNTMLHLQPYDQFKHDIQIHNHGDDWSYGFNAGLMFLYSDATKFGLAYRSAITHKVHGSSKVLFDQEDYPLRWIAKVFAGLQDSDVTGKVELPASLTFSAEHNMTNRWTVMTDVAYTFWDCLRKLTLSFSGTGHVLDPSTLILHYHNAWRVAIGQSYKLNRKWTLRNGFAFDETPTSAVYKTARIPDANRYWITVGANYWVNPNVNLDFGYAFILFEHSHTQQQLVDNPGPSDPLARISAHYRGIANLVGLQLNIDFNT